MNYPRMIRMAQNQLIKFKTAQIFCIIVRQKIDVFINTSKDLELASQTNFSKSLHFSSHFSNLTGKPTLTLQRAHTTRSRTYTLLQIFQPSRNGQSYTQLKVGIFSMRMYTRLPHVFVSLRKLLYYCIVVPFQLRYLFRIPWLRLLPSFVFFTRILGTHPPAMPSVYLCSILFIRVFQFLYTYI